jgi:hypothetical protein
MLMIWTKHNLKVISFSSLACLFVISSRKFMPHEELWCFLFLLCFWLTWFCIVYVLGRLHVHGNLHTFLPHLIPLHDVDNYTFDGHIFQVIIYSHHYLARQIFLTITIMPLLLCHYSEYSMNWAKSIVLDNRY